MIDLLQGYEVFDKLANLKNSSVKLRIVQTPPSAEFPDLDSLALAQMGTAEVLLPTVAHGGCASVMPHIILPLHTVGR